MMALTVDILMSMSILFSILLYCNTNFVYGVEYFVIETENSAEQPDIYSKPDTSMDV